MRISLLAAIMVYALGWWWQDQRKKRRAMFLQQLLRRIQDEEPTMTELFEGHSRNQVMRALRTLEGRGKIERLAPDAFTPGVPIEKQLRFRVRCQSEGRAF